MPKPDEVVLRTPEIEKRILDYIIQTSESSQDWWDSAYTEGSSPSRRDTFKEFRLRYQARRSIAGLYSDAKNDPFPRANNIGIGIEAITGEFLIPLMIANTYGLDPSLQVEDKRTKRVDPILTDFHNDYHHSAELGKQALLEESIREILTVGGVFHKWVWSSRWKQTESPVFVFSHPSFGPITTPNPQTGQMDFMYADPHMPEDSWPVGPDGSKLKMVQIPTSSLKLIWEGPKLVYRPIEAIGFPKGETRLDPNDWDYLDDYYTVSPYFFLGKEGDPFEGKYQNLDKLFKFLNIDRNRIYEKPDRRLTDPVRLQERHMKFPVTASGEPREIIAVVAPDYRLLLGWRLSPFPRRPYFNRQVRTRKDSPIGIGIPETVWGFRNAIDAALNQELDAGNLYNHPPLLMSTLAQVEDESYEMVGPGTQWIVQDINGVKFLSPPISQRNSIEIPNWLISMTQRYWGVTDLNMNAPTSSLSPNISTATGVMSVLNQGNIKFGHLVKRLSEVDSLEYEFVHSMFRAMLSNPRTISVDGTPKVLDPSDRERFFHEEVSIRSVGNGVTTNPTLRLQILMNYYSTMVQNPFVAGDSETLRDLTEQITQATGIKLSIKPSDELKFMGLIKQLMNTPNGKTRISQAVGESVQELQIPSTTIAGSQNGMGPGMGNGNAVSESVR